MIIPIFHTDAVVHIGDLSRRRMRNKGDSYEGSCLSVSRCPSAWGEIARISGKSYRIDAPTGQLMLIDVRSALHDQDLMQSVQEWAEERGYLVQSTLWRVWTTDEDGCFENSTFTSEALARSEVEFMDEPEAPEGHEPVEAIQAWVATDLLAQRMHQARFGDSDALDFALLAWVEDTQPDIHGAWWDDAFDPARLSAPRGGIFQSRLPDLRVSEGELADPSQSQQEWETCVSEEGDDFLSMGMSQGKIILRTGKDRFRAP